MKDENKTKAQLIDEMAALHERISQLELGEAELKEAEAVLLSAAQQWRATYDAIADGVFMLDAEGKVARCNQAISKRLQKSFDELIGHTCWELVHGTSEPPPSCPFALAPEYRRRHTMLHAVDDRWYSVVVDPIVDVDGSFVGAVCSMSDVTARKQAEDAVRESEERYRLIFESSPICLWEQDFSDVKRHLEDLRCSGVSDFRAYFQKHPEAVRECTSLVKLVDVNRTALDFYQAETKAELLRGLDHVFAEESYDVFMEELVSIAEGRTQFDWESSARTLGGERKDIALRWSVAPGFEETLARVVVSDVDITERKRAEEALRESEERFRYLSEAAFEGIATHEGGVLVAANDQYFEMLGFQPDELLGRQAIELTVAPEARQAMGEQIAGGGEGPYESTGLRKDGTRFPMEIRARQTTYEGREVRVATVVDITERKQAEELLCTQRDLALALSAAAGLGETLPLCLDAAIGVSGMECGGVYLVEEASGALSLAADKGLSAEFVQAVSHYEADSANARLVMAGNPAYTRYQELGVPLHEAERREGLRAIAVIPVRQEGTVIACINVASHALQEVPTFLRSGLEATAAQMANAIARARAEEEIRQQNKELLALTAIAETLSSSLNLREILDSALSKVLEILAVEAGGVYLVDETSQRLTLMAHHGVSEEFVSQVGELAVDEETIARATEMGKAGKLILAAELLLKDSTLLKAVTTAIGREKLRSYLQVIIRSKGTPAGLLVVASREGREFTAREEQSLSTIAHQIGLAVENVSLYEEQVDKVFQMDALRKTTLDIASQLDLDTVLRSIAARAVQLLRGTGGGLYLYRPEADLLEWAVRVGEGLAPVGTTLQRGEGLSGKVWGTGQPLIVDDYSHWEGRSRRYEAYRSEAVVGVPVHWQKKFLGVLNVLADAPRTFSSNDAELLSLFAGQAAIAIENARLFAEQERRAREMTALYETSLDISGRLALTDVLRSIMNRGVELLHTAGGAVWLYRPGEDELELAVDYGTPETYVGGRMKVGEGVSGKVFADRQAMAVEDYRHWEGRSRKFDSDIAGGMLGVPLMWGEQAIGVLNVNEIEKPRKFTEEEVRLLSLFASQAAVAIQNARLYEETWRRETQMETLHDVSLEIASELDLTVLLKTVAQRAIDLLGGPSGGLYLYRPERQELERVVHLGSEREYLGTTLRLGEGACGRAAQTGQALVVLDYANWEGRSVKFEDEGNFNVLAIPIKHGDSLLGALYINDSDLEREFDEADIRLATMFANQAAIAIENARLLNAVAKHKESLQELSSRLIDAQEQERKRIAQELHDEMGQALTAMSINLSVIDKQLGAELDPETAERLAETNSLITLTLEQMRELALDLRPSMLDDLGLLPALRWYVKRYENRTGIQVGLEAVGLELRLPEHIETAIYRVVQEALTNVARHARAGRVDIRLQRQDSIVQAFIEDDGSGFDLAEVADQEAQERGVGLVGMRERIAAAGGSLEIKSHPGKGTRLAIELPLP